MKKMGNEISGLAGKKYALLSFERIKVFFLLLILFLPLILTHSLLRRIDFPSSSGRADAVAAATAAAADIAAADIPAADIPAADIAPVAVGAAAAGMVPLSWSSWVLRGPRRD